MAHYIVCQRKKNNPRMDIRICEKKCPHKDACREYMAHHKIVEQEGSVSPPAESQSATLRAA
ncbi:MAG: hypothetical protein ACOWYE_09760 [Desulfatiglandales bacterium]